MVGRPRSFDRDDALKRSLMVFWKHGYDATSIAMLTEAIGIGAPSLYAAFGDKRALFDEALGYYAKTYGAFTVRAFQEETSARAAVERLLREAAAMFAGKDHPPGCLVISAATNCSPQSASVQKRLKSFRSMTVRALEEKMRNDQSGGALPPDVDVRALALFYSAMLQGMSAQARDGASRAELEAIAEAALQTWPR
ncbi:Transcriptional regulator, TetR family [Labilithrix luteola]|uniref:Transcriptional regulator, TetR family n=1 Tax=Labilithrix luteola TaxID=1391654 RepID=A0A0K1PPH4_9BACT|nr:TetR/AcrR family transcriptional regulator [Labilithrix luteola]AKU95019.1 Transcriptional regulator, TetR family [Labilithrix luteola]